MVTERNWLDVYPYQSWGGNANLPPLEVGQAFAPTELTLREVGGGREGGVGRVCGRGCVFGGLLLGGAASGAALTPNNATNTPQQHMQTHTKTAHTTTHATTHSNTQQKHTPTHANTQSQPRNANQSQGATAPPPRLSERDLIAAMERHGIGTDATVAEHIQKQLDRCAVALGVGAFLCVSVTVHRWLPVCFGSAFECDARARHQTQKHYNMRKTRKHTHKHINTQHHANHINTLTHNTTPTT